MGGITILFRTSSFPIFAFENNLLIPSLNKNPSFLYFIMVAGLYQYIPVISFKYNLGLRLETLHRLKTFRPVQKRNQKLDRAGGSNLPDLNLHPNLRNLR